MTNKDLKHIIENCDLYAAKLDLSVRYAQDKARYEEEISKLQAEIKQIPELQKKIEVLEKSGGRVGLRSKIKEMLNTYSKKDDGLTAVVKDGQLGVHANDYIGGRDPIGRKIKRFFGRKKGFLAETPQKIPGLRTPKSTLPKTLVPDKQMRIPPLARTLVPDKQDLLPNPPSLESLAEEQQSASRPDIRHPKAEKSYSTHIRKFETLLKKAPEGNYGVTSLQDIEQLYNLCQTLTKEAEVLKKDRSPELTELLQRYKDRMTADDKTIRKLIEKSSGVFGFLKKSTRQRFYYAGAVAHCWGPPLADERLSVNEIGDGTWRHPGNRVYKKHFKKCFKTKIKQNPW